ncbi:hypothetical protein ACW23B_11695 [Streptomyces albidoflavus]
MAGLDAATLSRWLDRAGRPVPGRGLRPGLTGAAPMARGRRHMSGCLDAATLSRWLDRAVTAETLDEVFAQD